MLSKSIAARALLLGQGMELRRLIYMLILSRDPTTIDVHGGGQAVLFDVPENAEKALLAQLEEFIHDPFESPAVEELDIRLVPDAEEQFLNGELVLQLMDIPRVQVIADILAKSVFLITTSRRRLVPSSVSSPWPNACNRAPGCHARPRN
jgi:hypothetical protein